MQPSKVEIINVNKHDRYVFDGYIYEIIRHSTNVTYLRCCVCKKVNVKIVHDKEMQFYYTRNTKHNHKPTIDVEKYRQRHLVEENLDQIPRAIETKINDNHRCLLSADAISSHRKRIRDKCGIVRNFQQIRTADKHNGYVLADGNNFVMFGTISGLMSLARTNDIFADGTFKIVNSKGQLYTLHALINGKRFCCLSIKMNNRTSSLYKTVFSTIEHLANCLGFTIFRREVEFHCDFEKAVIGTMKDKFPQVMIRGCYFHFKQAIMKKVKSLGASDYYDNYQPFRNFVHRVSTLPLLPPSFVNSNVLSILYRTFQQEVHSGKLSASVRKNGNNCMLIAESLMKYMYNTWFKRFPPNLWNCFGSNNRTNNYCESFHHSLIENKGSGRGISFLVLALIKQYNKDVSEVTSNKRVSFHRQTESLLRRQALLLNKGDILPIDYLDNVKYILKNQIISVCCFKKDKNGPTLNEFLSNENMMYEYEEDEEDEGEKEDEEDEGEKEDEDEQICFEQDIEDLSEECSNAEEIVEEEIPESQIHPVHENNEMDEFHLLGMTNEYISQLYKNVSDNSVGTLDSVTAIELDKDVTVHLEKSEEVIEFCKEQLVKQKVKRDFFSKDIEFELYFDKMFRTGTKQFESQVRTSNDISDHEQTHCQEQSPRKSPKTNRSTCSDGSTNQYRDNCFSYGHPPEYYERYQQNPYNHPPEYYERHQKKPYCYPSGYYEGNQQSFSDHYPPQYYQRDLHQSFCYCPMINPQFFMYIILVI